MSKRESDSPPPEGKGFDPFQEGGIERESPAPKKSDTEDSKKEIGEIPTEGSLKTGDIREI